MYVAYQRKPNEDLIKYIYHKRDLKANDVMVTVFCEKVLFK